MNRSIPWSCLILAYFYFEFLRKSSLFVQTATKYWKCRKRALFCDIKLIVPKHFFSPKHKWKSACVCKSNKMISLIPYKVWSFVCFAIHIWRFLKSKLTLICAFFISLSYDSQFDYLVNVMCIAYMRRHFNVFNKVCFPSFWRSIRCDDGILLIFPLNFLVAFNKSICMERFMYQWMHIVANCVPKRIAFQRIHVNQIRISRSVYIWWIRMQNALQYRIIDESIWAKKRNAIAKLNCV